MALTVVGSTNCGSSGDQIQYSLPSGSAAGDLVVAMAYVQMTSLGGAHWYDTAIKWQHANFDSVTIDIESGPHESSPAAHDIFGFTEPSSDSSLPITAGAGQRFYLTADDIAQGFFWGQAFSGNFEGAPGFNNMAGVAFVFHTDAADTICRAGDPWTSTGTFTGSGSGARPTSGTSYIMINVCMFKWPGSPAGMSADWDHFEQCQENVSYGIGMGAWDAVTSPTDPPYDAMIPGGGATTSDVKQFMNFAVIEAPLMAIDNMATLTVTPLAANIAPPPSFPIDTPGSLTLAPMVPSLKSPVILAIDNPEALTLTPLVPTLTPLVDFPYDTKAALTLAPLAPTLTKDPPDTVPGSVTGSKCIYLAQVLIDLVLGQASWTPPATVYIALSLMPFDHLTTGADLTGDGTNEVAPGFFGSFGYQRVAVTNDFSSGWETADGAALKHNLNDWTFPDATGDWGTITSFYILDGNTFSAADNCLYGSNVDPLTVLNGDPGPVFLAGDITIQEA